MAANDTSTGRYRLIEPVGAGGMGTVWRGRDTLLDREVAIKVIALTDGLGGAERAEVYAQAVREARTAARIRHPNVVPVDDVVVGNDEQPPWIIMEFVRGRPMDAVIRQDGPLSPARVADLGAQVLDGLAAGHAEGVLHRDLKPANVMITSEGRALVTDFGIAKLIGDPQWTRPGQVRGTPEYIPPERAWGGEGTPASDLFALGATMFAAFRGQGPFHRDGVDAALDAARHDAGCATAPTIP
jgi:eukaryotic-like serine/threonine-protein kinase